ncbi:MAG: cysteine--tRNA ligase [Ignavibacteriales bacterium]|nr:cysteine--tRNA ligase [Ignavibacteriales bacterium]
MSLNIYNTLVRQKEEFKPLVEGRVNMYVCGPTVYGHSHIGHAKSYVSFDIIVRYLRYLGYKTLYVQNITDVGHLTDDADEGEDKIAKQSKKDRVHPMQVVESYTRSYFEDMDALGVVRPDISPRATGHIIEQIEMARDLIKKGFAYEKNGSVYFNVAKFKEYGKLSRRPLEEMEAGARVEVNKEKRNPADFALWKKADAEHIMQWESPWGMGFPGWHLECSAMSMKYLGETFDIHGGGMENQFPHHECEIAQSECSTGKQFVKYWIHNNMVTVGGQKMGKSLGNVINLKDAFKKYTPLVVRFFILQSHYRSTLDFTNEALDGASKGYEKLLNTVRNVRNEIEKLGKSENQKNEDVPFLDLTGFKKAFLEAMDDDFNSPQAIGVLFDLNREVNTVLAGSKSNLKLLNEINGIYNELAGTVLGIIPDQLESAVAGGGENDLIQFIIELRAEARAQKLWVMSDKIRDGLKNLGIVIEDKKDGTTWRRE